MASRVRTPLTLNEVLSGVFDDDFGLSDTKSSEVIQSLLTLESIICE